VIVVNARMLHTELTGVNFSTILNISKRKTKKETFIIAVILFLILFLNCY